MDSHVFDDLTRLVSAPRSRRAAWRALLAGALLGATTRTAMADSSTPCANGKNPACMCGQTRDCDPGKCFVDEAGSCPVCCTKEHDLVICGGKCCKALNER